MKCLPKFILVFILLLSIGLFAQTSAGDVDEDGEITILDALLVARHHLSLPTPEFTAPVEAGDVNLDDEIQAVDAIMIAQFFAGLIDSLPLPTITMPETGGIHLEAEFYDRVSDNDAVNNGERIYDSGLDVEDCWEGGFNTCWVSGGEWLEWDLILTEPSDECNVWIRVAHDNEFPLPCRVIINSELVGDTVNVENTDPFGVPHPPGNWQTWISEYVGSYNLRQGVNTVKLEYTDPSGGANLDYIYLTKEENGPPARTIQAPGGYVKPVDKYGNLQVIGTNLCNSDGDPIQLKGVTTETIRWNYYGKGHTIQRLAYNLGIELFRITLFVTPNDHGYLAPDLTALMHSHLVSYIDDAIEAGIYVIIDWNIVKEGDPDLYTEEAIEFFDEMSEKYGDLPNVIYEICDEPKVSWENVKSYAEEVIPVIRANDPDNIIIVGTPSQSKEPHIASRDPITGQTNVMYGLHFAAYDDDQELRDTADIALGNDLPIFVSEWTAHDAAGNSKANDPEDPKDIGLYDLEEAELWHSWMADNNLSWVYGEFTNKSTRGKRMLVLRTGLSGHPDVENKTIVPWDPVIDFTVTGEWALDKIQN
ncbi:cellulase family glycosylhydrolase [candidate division WOR-3 bacterium]|nr:cellulase family glycosylhydrolase [candidate division WOR-3 bacterium]